MTTTYEGFSELCDLIDHAAHCEQQNCYHQLAIANLQFGEKLEVFEARYGDFWELYNQMNNGAY